MKNSAYFIESEQWHRLGFWMAIFTIQEVCISRLMRLYPNLENTSLEISQYAIHY